MAEGKTPRKGSAAGEAGTAESNIRRGGTRAVGAALSPLVRNAFRRQGFAATEVVTRWAAIVGERVARRSLPERVTFPTGKSVGGTLHIRVEGPMATELQHVEPQVIERVNAFYGYPAIANVALKQGRLPPTRRSVPKPKRVLSEDARNTLDTALAGTSNEGLRAALEALGRQVLAPNRRP